MQMAKTGNRELHIDLETYSELDIREVGAYKYVNHESFEILLLAYAFDNEPVSIIDLAQGEEIPSSVLKALFDYSITKVAHNANFERTCLSKVIGLMVPSQWRCTAVRASTLGLPRSLADVGKVLGLAEDQQKMKIGKSLIAYFCKPCKPTIKNHGRTRNLPHHDLDKWDLFKQYCCQDVVTERAIDKKMDAYPSTTRRELELWQLDQTINDYGVKVEQELVNNILDFYAIYTDRLLTRAREITKLDNPGSTSQIKSYLLSKGIEVESIDKDHVKALISDLKSGDIKTPYKDEILEFLSIRKELGKTSVSKYDAMKRSLCSDGRIRGMLQFYGANRTGRWAGRIVQLHNLPKNKLADLDYARDLVIHNDMDLIEMLFGSPLDIFSQLIRTSFIAHPRKTFVVADYSAIEARVISWLANETWRQEVFAKNGDIYCASASQMFKVPVEKHGVNGHLRAKGKIAELALGYQGAKGALLAMGAEEMGLSEAELDDLVVSWRNANPHIVELWNKTERAAMAAVEAPGTIQHVTKGIAFRMINDSLFCKLPSGRCLAYFGANIQKTKNKKSIIYQGTNQESGRWEHVETYGGKLVENLTQAIARDCLGEAMLQLYENGFGVRFHVHDEVIVEVNIDEADLKEKQIRSIMALDNVTWLDGLILNADSYQTSYYKKD